MSEHLKVVSSKTAAAKISLILVIMFALGFAWFTVRWQFGNMFASLTSPASDNAKEISVVASGLAPNDPWAKWLQASVEKDIYTPEKIERSVNLYEDVVRLSPYDYRWWIELGRAYEQAEKLPQAESAFKKAVELAPNYTYPHWQFGNFLIRRNRSDEAFAELQKAAEKNQSYREQVFLMAWDFFDKNIEKVEQLGGNSPEAKKTLVKFYVNKGLSADALRIWNTLSDEEKQKNPETSKLIAQVLYEKRFYRSAVEFARQLGIDPESKAETVTNGSFEKVLGLPEETFFNWKITSSPADKIDIKTDSSVKKDGTRSLKINFNGYQKNDLLNAWQIVAVQPKKKYRLSFWLKTEGLKSAGTPQLEIVNANDDKMIVATKPFAVGTNDWQEVILEFTAPDNCEGIMIRTGRAFCGEGCPIVGTVWYDNFVLN
ncbi:MAG TPA: carbohydrate binding domain-containing protein [Pyrinomonadaceae bacterium]|nr:carbohydrate binding domain-containing protein [Pyrinomonadaceae bacterium]